MLLFKIKNTNLNAGKKVRSSTSLIPFPADGHSDIQMITLQTLPIWTLNIPSSIWHCVDCADIRYCIKSKDGTKLVSSSYVVLLDNEQKWTTLRRKRGAIVNAWCRIQNVVLFYIQWYILSLLSCFAVFQYLICKAKDYYCWQRFGWVNSFNKWIFNRKARLRTRA